MRIILIEDRVIRKLQFIDLTGISLEKYGFLKEVNAEEYMIIKNSLKVDNFIFFNDYDLIITHKSAFTIGEQDKINSLRKPIVYFSGGISQAFYAENSSPILHINSKDFYSENLEFFLDFLDKNNEIELLILQFGKQWKLNLLLNTRDSISQLIYSNANNDLFPDDFDIIFNKKVLSVINSNNLKTEIETLLLNGLRYTNIEKINDIKIGLSKEIRKIINPNLI